MISINSKEIKKLCKNNDYIPHSSAGWHFQSHNNVIMDRGSNQKDYMSVLEVCVCFVGAERSKKANHHLPQREINK